MRRFHQCLMLCTALTFCLPSLAEDRDTLAAAGRIQESAPVKAASEIVIHAPRERVWALLTGVDAWPTWQRNVSSASLHGSLSPGTTFSWKTGGTQIESRLALVHPQEEIVWTGTAMKAHAIHIWTLQTLPDGTTLVKTNESMDGFMLSVFYSSKDLEKTHQQWLSALKQAAEKPA